MKESGTANGLHGTHNVDIEQMGSFEGVIRGKVITYFSSFSVFNHLPILNLEP